MKKILIVEDDINLGTSLASALELYGYTVHYLSSAVLLTKELQTLKPDIVLMDVMLGEKKDGFEWGRQIRKMSDMPIVFTTSRDENIDFKTAFSLGNTDYVRKPYKLQEILSRVELLLSKQSAPDVDTVYPIGAYFFDTTNQTLRLETEETHLNRLESSILQLLHNNINVYIDRETIIESVWGITEAKLKSDSLNNILSSLRKHLQNDKSIHLESKTGLGVRLQIKHR